MKTKRLFIGLAAMFAVGVSAGAASALSLKEASPMQAKAASAETGLDLCVVGDGVKKDSTPWENNTGFGLTEIRPGVYSIIFYSAGGQVTFLERGSWTNHRYYFASLDPECQAAKSGSIVSWKTQSGDDSKDDNLFIRNWGYYRFTIDTTKDSYPLTGELIYSERPPTIAGEGVANGAWNCSSVDYIFDTEDGVVFTQTVTTGKSGSWRIVAWDLAWVTRANATNLDAASSCYGEFSDGGGNDHNITVSKEATYRVEWDSRTNKLYIDDNAGYDVTYKWGDVVLGQGKSKVDTAYVTRSYTISHLDANKRFYGWYMDSEFNEPYSSRTLSSNTILYGKFLDYANTVYYAPGPNYDWSGAKIYAWDANAHDVTSGWPGDVMTRLGGGIYSHTFVGEQNPAGVKFSETGNDGNKTGDCAYPDGKNIYVYEKYDYYAITEEDILLEAFGEAFLSDTAAACSSSNVTAEVWANTKAHAAALLANESAKAKAKGDVGFFGALELENDPFELAMARYDVIVAKYHYEDYLLRNSNSGINVNPMMRNDIAVTAIVVSALVLVSGAAVIGLLSKKRRLQ